MFKELIQAELRATLCPVTSAAGAHGAAGAAVAGAAFRGPSVPAPRSAEAHSPRGWLDS